MRCESCGFQKENPDFFYVNYGGKTECLRCAVKRIKSFYNFCLFWRKKVTSEHGKEINEKIIKETKTLLDSLEKKARLLQSQQRIKG